MGRAFRVAQLCSGMHAAARAAASRRGRALVRASVVAVLLALPASAFAQWFPREREAVSVGLSFGTVNLDGAEDSNPPKGRPPVWSVRVSIPVKRALSLDGEFARSGLVDNGGSFFRERRRDVLAAVYARLDLWRKGLVAVHPIVGISVVKPMRQVTATTFDTANGQWKEQRLSDREYPDYPHTWALSWGTDVSIGTGHLAIVPEFRAHEHFSNPSPWLSARILRTVSGSVGIRYRF